VRGCTFAHLGLQAVGIYGGGAGRKDVSGHNALLESHIHHVALSKFDAPAVVLWHTAFNRMAHNHVHDLPSKAVFIGGQRSNSLDPKPLDGRLSIHEAGWLMARWEEIPDHVTISGSEGDITVTPAIMTPGDEFAVDRRLAHYRYTRANTIEHNVFANCHAATGTLFFGDGVIYVSGVAANSTDDANAVIGNVLVGNPTLYGQGGSMYESIYADGFGGALRVEENAVLVGDRGGVQLCTWWGHGTLAANVFDDIGGDITVNINCDGNELFTPTSNLHLDADDDDLHDPQPDATKTYAAIYRRVCAPDLPAPPPLAPTPA